MDAIAMQEVVNDCAFYPFIFDVSVDGRGAIYLQGHFVEEDVNDGTPAPQHTRRWLLSPHMTKSEIVQTVFKCAITASEHEVRERFTYRGRTVFGPHFDVDALWGICGQDDKR